MLVTRLEHWSFDPCSTARSPGCGVPLPPRHGLAAAEPMPLPPLELLASVSSEYHSPPRARCAAATMAAMLAGTRYGHGGGVHHWLSFARLRVRMVACCGGSLVLVVHASRQCASAGRLFVSREGVRLRAGIFPTGGMEIIGVKSTISYPFGKDAIPRVRKLPCFLPLSPYPSPYPSGWVPVLVTGFPPPTSSPPLTKLPPTQNQNTGTVGEERWRGG